ncbi:dihydrolipoyl dehydrogenase [Alicyclobacillaceae bacterium I2511]|nr:dihydrolipoyl dehydrogenase [Alicyclobacillaceae bacterium I2511]
MVAQKDYHLVVLGGGTGGYVAAIRAAQLGFCVAIVEQEQLGGTCLHKGCIPTKALLRTAEVWSTVHHASTFGITIGEATLDFSQAMSRKADIVKQLYKGIQFLMKKNQIDVIAGRGRLMGPSIFSPQAGAVRVQETSGDSQILTPRFTLVATGSTPKELPGLDFDGVFVLHSDHALSMTVLPLSAIIVGGGAIGVEWASLWNDMGVKVTVVEFMPSLLPAEDAEVSAELTRSFKKRKIQVLTETRILSDTLEKHGDGLTVQVRKGDHVETLSASVLLVAVGRTPNTQDIGLEAIEMPLHQGAIVVNGDFQTAEKNIFAIGDVIGGLQLAHVAAHEGIHAVEVMAGLHPAPLNESWIPRCTYTRPEVASLGLTEAQAKEQGYTVKTGKFSFKANGKALILGEPNGFVKIVADSIHDDLLGIHMIGPHVTDLVSEAALAKVLDATPWEIGITVHPHPTLSEAFGEAALAVNGQSIHI